MLRRAAFTAVCLAVAGCGLVGPPSTGPHGLSSYDGDLRRLSASGHFDQALAVAEEEAGDAGDELLAELNRAVVEHYAGRYEESNARLQAADQAIEERYTKSVSRAAFSLVTSDRALAWLPSSSERLMIHVYGALNYLALDEPDEAAVEARRLALLLDRLVEEDGVEESGADTRRLYRSLRYFTAAVFEQAGERNDADVAYRLAGLDARGDVSGGPPGGEAGDLEAGSAPAGGLGSVVVLVESGFVAHRIEQSAHFILGVGELDDLRYGSDARRRRYARCFSHRRLGGTVGSWDVAHDDWCSGLDRRKRRDDDDHDDDDVSYLMRLAWPTMRQAPTARPVGPVRAFSDAAAPPPVLTAARDAAGLATSHGTTPDPARGAPSDDTAETDRLSRPLESGRPLMSADLSGAVVHDFNRKAPGILVKSIARAAVKYTVVQELEEGARKEDETLGDVAAVVGNVVAALTERADTRSWTLLPAQLQLVRLDLPPGEHPIRVAIDGEGSVSDDSAAERVLELGTVEVRPGRTTVLSTRVWP
ncbi:MAG: hypothetical protein ACODAB_09215 [Gemmatimonadota bacterium]